MTLSEVPGVPLLPKAGFWALGLPLALYSYFSLLLLYLRDKGVPPVT